LKATVLFNNLTFCGCVTYWSIGTWPKYQILLDVSGLQQKLIQHMYRLKRFKETIEQFFCSKYN